MIRTNRHFDIPSKLYRKLVCMNYDTFKDKCYIMCYIQGWDYSDNSLSKYIKEIYGNDKQLLEYLKQYDI